MFYTKETFEEKCLEKMPDSNFKMIQFNGIKNPCSFLCLKCNNTLSYQNADKIIDRGRRGLKNVCKFCEDTKQKRPREKAKEKVKNILKEKNSLTLLDEIRDLRKKVNWHCKKCNHNFQRSTNAFLNNSKCPWCEGVFDKINIDILQERAKDLYGDEYFILDEEYDVKKSNKITVKHNLCGFVWKINSNSFLQGHCCPNCKSSQGERKVRNYLKKYNFDFKEQYSFSNDDKIKNKKFDFYLNIDEKQIVIEYNGRQHYQPVDFFGGIEGFLKQQERDNIKKDYCLKNNIELIVIPWYDEHIIQTDELAQRLNGIKFA